MSSHSTPEIVSRFEKSQYDLVLQSSRLAFARGAVLPVRLLEWLIQ